MKKIIPILLIVAFISPYFVNIAKVQAAENLSRAQYIEGLRADIDRKYDYTYGHKFTPEEIADMKQQVATWDASVAAGGIQNGKTGAPADQNLPTTVPGDAGHVPDTSGCSITSPSTWIPCAISKTGEIILTVASWVLMLAGLSFDISVNYSLNMAKLLSDYKIVDIGWNVLRDITNIMFIFIILFIAINMILGIPKYGDKGLIATVIVTALLVNFSLFATKVVIDATNIGALQFYNLLVPASNSNTAAATGISEQFMEVVNLQSVYTAGKNGTGNSLNINTIVSGNFLSGVAGSAELFLKIAMITILGSIFILATAVVFFAGAFMFLTRSIMLLFLMMGSSFAFAARALPATKHFFDDWLHKLIKNAIFAPVFLALLYILITAIKGTGASRGINFGNMILNGQGIDGFIYFAITMGALVGILLISSKLGIMGADTAHGFLNKRVGKGNWFGVKNMAKGASARTFGRAATATAESGFARSLARVVPGISKPLSQVGKTTGWAGVKSAKKEEEKFISGVSSQGQFESDFNYARRKKKAEARGLSSLGLDETGKEKTGWFARKYNTARKILGGPAFADLQRAKQKEIKKNERDKTRGAAQKVSTIVGVQNLTGLNLMSDPAKKEIDTDKVVDLFTQLQEENITVSKSGDTVKIGNHTIQKNATTGETPEIVAGAMEMINGRDVESRRGGKNTYNTQLSLIRTKLKSYIDAVNKEEEKSERDAKEKEKDGKKDDTKPPKDSSSSKP